MQHASNVPVVYNPLTTHISPQFHVVFDDQFTTVSDSALSLTDNFYERLYQTAKWTYEDTFAYASDLHLLQDVSLHHQPSLPPHSHKSRHKTLPSTKRRATNPTGHPAETHQESHPTSIPTESHPASILPVSQPAAPITEGHPASNPDVSHPTAFLTESQPAPYPAESHPASPRDDHNLTSIPEESQPAPEVGSRSPGATHTEFQKKRKRTAEADGHIHLCPIPCSANLTDYKRRHGIQASVFIATATAADITPSESSPLFPCSSSLHTAPNPLVFTAEVDAIHPTSASLTCNNSEDILIQRQMFKASDSDLNKSVQERCHGTSSHP